MNRFFFETYMSNEPEAPEDRYIFLVDKKALSERIVLAGYRSTPILSYETDGECYCLGSFLEYLKSLEFKGSCRSDYVYVVACSVKSTNDAISQYLSGEGLSFRSGWRLFSGKDYLEEQDHEEDLKKILSEYTHKGQTTSLNVYSIDRIEAKSVEWLVPYYIPRKGVTVLGADGGSGKTTVTASLIAQISAGRKTFLTEGISPEGFMEAPGKVLWLNAEDPLPEVLVPMLKANDAVMKNIFVLDEKQIIESGICYSDERLKKVIKDLKPDLVVFDPLQQFLPERVKMAERNLMRREAGHAMTLAQDCDCAVMIVMHTNKQKGVSGRKRLADSADVWDMSRSVLMMGINEHDNDIRYLSQEKNNFERLQDSINFTINKDRTIRVLSRDQMRDHDHVTALNQEAGFSKTSSKDSARKAILEILEKSDDNILPSKDLESELREGYGIGVNAINTAKSELRKEGAIKITSRGGGKSAGKKIWYVGLANIH